VLNAKLPELHGMSKTPSLFTPADELTDILGPDLAAHFIAHRKALKKPMTAFAAQLMAKKLRGFPDPVAAIEQSILKGWCDVFPISPDNSYKTNNRPITGVAGEREKLRQEIENERQGQTSEDSGHAGWLLEFDRQRPDRPH
jgi:hypothetical protein